MESILPIRKFHVENYPLLIPFNGAVGSGTGGKIQRMQSPIDMVWDDGTKMRMVFQQNQNVNLVTHIDNIRKL